MIGLLLNHLLWVLMLLVNHLCETLPMLIDILLIWVIEVYIILIRLQWLIVSLELFYYLD
jgi:hypothetical protein